MELRDYARVLRRRWLTVALVAILGLAAAATATFFTTQRYTATTRLFFGVQSTESATEMAQGSSFAERQMTSYAEVATAPLVLAPVIKQLGLATTPALLAQEMTVAVPTDTVILQLSVTDTDPVRAAAIANAAATEVAQVAASLSPERSDGSQAVRATILTPAEVPLRPSSPSIPLNLALGLLVGVGLGAGLALVRTALDTRVRSENDVRAVTQVSVIGAIPFEEAVPENPVILRADPRSAASEAIRRLRTNLQFIGVGSGTRSLVITSSVPTEGKTITAINLAVSLADAGARVLLIDADLRRPSVAEHLGLEGAAGLTTVLIGRAGIQDVVQPWSDSTLDVLVAGQIPPNPSELLGSPAMQALLAELKGTYDMVLIDSPPILPVTDAAVLGRQVAGALMVAGMNAIHRPQLRESLATLETAGCPVLGMVVNKLGKREVGPYDYPRSYYYDSATAAPLEQHETAPVPVSARRATV